MCALKWIADNVTPNIKEVFGMELAVLFRKAMLWLAYSPNNGLLPPAKLQAIQDACCNCAMLLAGLNPVQKRLVTVSGEDAVMHMHVAPDIAPVNEQHNTDNDNSTGPNNDPPPPAAPVNVDMAPATSGSAKQPLLAPLSQTNLL